VDCDEVSNEAVQKLPEASLGHPSERGGRDLAIKDSRVDSVSVTEIKDEL
jgi:hypothetical protein